VRRRAKVHVVLPNDVDDPADPSGGNTYDRRLCTGLSALGWAVREHPVRGTWPDPAPAARAGLARVLAALPDGALVLLDGLVSSAVPDVLAPERDRLRLVVLVHMPLGTEAERAALAAARAVVTTSRWSRDQLDAPVPAYVATPGVDPAPLARASAAGDRLLCVGPVTRHKGHDRLVEALATIPDLWWRCLCVGPLHRDPGFVERLPRMDRVRYAGPLVGTRLARAYADADLLVLPSRAETYGMVVTEALARGIPVLATAVGGVAEALGRAPDGSLPGMLIEPTGLAGALRCWLTDPTLRDQLRASALGRRQTLSGWELTARRVAGVLTDLRSAAK
jgi:glycosyltransferase involved in cell wall biosynthesis